MRLCPRSGLRAELIEHWVGTGLGAIPPGPMDVARPCSKNPHYFRHEDSQNSGPGCCLYDSNSRRTDRHAKSLHIMDGGAARPLLGFREYWNLFSPFNEPKPRARKETRSIVLVLATRTQARTPPFPRYSSESFGPVTKRFAIHHQSTRKELNLRLSVISRALSP